MNKTTIKTHSIPSVYSPGDVESRLYAFWLEQDLFRTNPNSGKPPYCIMMPPPNITGELHMGHALQDSLQDMLIRLKRMQGYEALWQAGKDHAGIATQNVVERTLAKEGVTRQQLGRERFLERVWEWKERYGNRIFEQKRLLGDSADWSRERFTLDESLSRAVARVFVHLFNRGLIYRGWYIVNWCPRCHTAISDEEVDHEPHQGHLWYFRYPLKSAGGTDFARRFVVVATTRPETMLGDTAVAVNPDDPRFTDIIGRTVLLPLVNREIPVVADPTVDPQFGTGQVKVTPAHDADDFQIGQRHHLPSVVVMDENGVLNENVPPPFRGMDRFAAREAVVKAMAEAGLLEKVEDYSTSIGHCQRCRTIIEPYLSRQWFVRMKPLAEPAIEAVKSGKVRFFPPRWEKVYYQWMENIRDWCISRQLWWGHRIPVWYCRACGAVIVREEAPDTCPKCGSADLHQDEDVLDTWFSSWLWPFSTLGWPDSTPELNFWYPTDVLVSGYDIIFFWIARMIMAGLECTGKVPFRDVYITGMVRDEFGRWMSKSLGNGIDPAEMVKEYGADAVRFTLISLASEGQDIKLAPTRFQGGRNFANKLWNTYRFLATNLTSLEAALPEENGVTYRVLSDVSAVLTHPQTLPERWMASRLSASASAVLEAVDKYRLNDCATLIYDLVWKEYCDWYLELLKSRLSTEVPPAARARALAFAVGLFEAMLRLLHPIMPFITEEVFQFLRERGLPGVASIMVAPYPKPEDFPRDPAAEADMALLQRIVTAVRNIRSEMRVPPERKATLVVANCNDVRRRLIVDNLEDIKRLAGLQSVEFSGVRPSQSAAAVVEEMELFVPLGGLIDLLTERVRLDREIARLQAVVRAAEAKLGNSNFIDKAPADVVEAERRKRDECLTQLESLRRNRQFLGD